MSIIFLHKCSKAFKYNLIANAINDYRHTQLHMSTCNRKVINREFIKVHVPATLSHWTKMSTYGMSVFPVILYF